MISQELPRFLVVRRIVRPTRFAFLVRSDDVEGLSNAVAINSSIWGGVRNSIVPVHSRVQKWPEAERSLTPQEIVQGMVRRIDPDYIVEMTPGLGDEMQLVGRVIGEHALSKSIPTFALGMAPLFDHISRIRRSSPTALPPVYFPQGEPRIRLLTSVCFGAFPAKLDLAFLSSSFHELFQPNTMHVSALSIIQAQVTCKNYPLQMTGEFLKSAVSLVRRAPGIAKLFLVNPLSVTDLIDFWNLRAAGWSTVAVPISAVSTNIDICRELLSESPGFFEEPYTLMKGRSVSKKTFEQFKESLEIENDIGVFPHIPRFWDRIDGSYDLGFAEWYESEEHMKISGGRLEVSTSGPRFLTQLHKKPAACWWGVDVDLKNVHGNDAKASFFPDEAGPLDGILHAPPFSYLRLTSTGVSLITENVGYQIDLDLPDSIAVFKQWFANWGYVVKLDVKGRIFLELINAVGQLHGIRLIQSAGIVDLLNKMAQGLVSFPFSGEQKIPTTARARFASRQEWMKTLGQVNSNVHESQEHLAALLAHGVLQVGLVLHCDNCGHENWYSPDSLASWVNCERCLSALSFPASQPPKEKQWHYKTRGVFSVDRYLQGGYAVAFALSYLSRALSGSLVWAPSFRLSSDFMDEREIDFAVFYRRFARAQTQLIFGECKMHDSFEAKDFSLAAELLQSFPESFFVFASARGALTEDEKSAIRRLNVQFARYKDGRRKRASVVVLTGAEMLNREMVKGSRKDRGQANLLAAEIDRYSDPMAAFCYISQRRYVD